MWTKSRLISGIQRRLVEPVIRQRLTDLDLDMRLLSLERSLDKLLESPRYLPSNGVGFNGQQGRKKVFADIVDAIQFSAIVETGTFFGDTAAFMHEATKLPVLTCESNRHYYLLAKKRLAEFSRITLDHTDSRQFLRSLAKTTLTRETVFFYLDAHWYRDVPLKAEIQIIAESWGQFVVMVDDFEVPGDNGYKYESSYFVLDNLVDQLEPYELKAYFPSLHSSEETGWSASRPWMPRGCVVITRVGLLSEMLARLSSLREASPEVRPPS